MSIKIAFAFLAVVGCGLRPSHHPETAHDQFRGVNVLRLDLPQYSRDEERVVLAHDENAEAVSFTFSIRGSVETGPTLAKCDFEISVDGKPLPHGATRYEPKFEGAWLSQTLQTMVSVADAKGLARAQTFQMRFCQREVELQAWDVTGVNELATQL